MENKKFFVNVFSADKNHSFYDISIGWLTIEAHDISEAKAKAKEILSLPRNEMEKIVPFNDLYYSAYHKPDRLRMLITHDGKRYWVHEKNFKKNDTETNNSKKNSDMETNKVKLSDLKESERIDAIKEKYGDAESFLTKVNPSAQTLCSDFDNVLSESDYYPSLNDLRITYGKNFAAIWLVPQIDNLTLFTGAKNITEQQHEELSKIIAKEFGWLPITAVLNFFYSIKSCKFPRIDENLTPMVITSYMRQFLHRYNVRKWFAERPNSVFLIVDDQPKAKVYARVFGTKIKAENALKERDERTGEKRYPSCHVIERNIE